jgi:hypothetical protein
MEPTLMRSKIFLLARLPPCQILRHRPNIRESGLGCSPGPKELVIFEGPATDTNIDSAESPSARRMQNWIDSNVHVPGKDNWIFVKTYTHSAASLDVASGVSNWVGENADHFYSDIEAQYNDGVNYKLHYCSAREAYNIAVAAADGVPGGDPGAYRDYRIPPPCNKY